MPKYERSIRKFLPEMSHPNPMSHRESPELQALMLEKDLENKIMEKNE